MMDIVLFLCFHSFTDGLSQSLSHSLSTQSPIDREICRSRIMEIVPFLCFHCFMDGHSLSLSCSLPMQSPIEREICRSCIMDIVLFLCFHHLMDGHSLSLYAISYRLGNMQISYYGHSTISVFSSFHGWT